MVGFPKGFPSGSVSFAFTLITKGVPAGVITLSFNATGGLFTPTTAIGSVTLITTVAVSQSIGEPLSQTRYLNISVPTKVGFGV